MDMQVCTEPSESQEKKHIFSGYAIGRNIHQPPNIIALYLKRSANFSLNELSFVRQDVDSRFVSSTSAMQNAIESGLIITGGADIDQEAWGI